MRMSKMMMASLLWAIGAGCGGDGDGGTGGSAGSAQPARERADSLHGAECPDDGLVHVEHGERTALRRRLVRPVAASKVERRVGACVQEPPPRRC